MDVFLDPAIGRNKSEALFEQLREAIVSGRLHHGDRLPATRVLAAELGVARSTITTVYGRLVAEGYVEGRAGGGSSVSYRRAGASESPTRPTTLSAPNLGLLDTTRWSLGGFDAAPPAFDLRSGRPDPAFFPLLEWRRAMSDALHVAPTGYMEPAGRADLRRALAHWVQRSRAVDADPDQVMVTAGAQQGVDVIARLLLRPGDVVAVEDPGYPPVRSLFLALGAAVVPVPVDRDGLVVDRIPDDARLVYVTPSHQSPTGAVMSLDRRRALLDLAERRDLVIVEDDYDSEYRHEDRPLEPLHRLDRNGRVVYVGTFSKTLAPSLRLGFLVLPTALVHDATTLRSLMDWQPPDASQRALHRFVTDGALDRHLRRTRRRYRERHALVAAFCHDAAEQGLVAEAHHHVAGLHTTVHLPQGVAEAAVRARAGHDGVALGDYGQCWQAEDHPEGLIIGFGAVTTADLPEALRRVDSALRHAAG